MGNYTDMKEADESKSEWPSGTQTGLIPAPYSFEHSDTKTDSFAAPSCDGQGVLVHSLPTVNKVLLRVVRKNS